MTNKYGLYFEENLKIKIGKKDYCNLDHYSIRNGTRRIKITTSKVRDEINKLEETLLETLHLSTLEGSNNPITNSDAEQAEIIRDLIEQRRSIIRYYTKKHIIN
ncbi:MAG: hypothetical protein PHF86_13935 [Candidatus Nanoarchaeia archaeon]|nr:hypothetical protein [Candidatus Nanoarchaeia archaeon]